MKRISKKADLVKELLELKRGDDCLWWVASMVDGGFMIGIAAHKDDMREALDGIPENDPSFATILKMDRAGLEALRGEIEIILKNDVSAKQSN